MSTAYWSLYAIAFGFGMVIFAIMFLISLAKASRGGARERAAFLEALPKFYFYTPLIALVPATVAWVYAQIAQPMEQVIGDETTNAMKELIAYTNKFFFQDPMGLLNQVGGAIVAFFLFLGTVVVMLVWLIEHEVAKFGVYLLTIMVPIAAALSLNPKWVKMGGRAVAAVIGCMAVPVITKLAFWVAWKAMGDSLRTTDNFMMSLITILVIFSLATSAPIMLSYLAPNLLPYGGTAYGNSGGSARGHSQQAMDHAGDALSRLTNGFKGKGMSLGGEGAAGGRAAGAAGAEAAGGAAAGGAAAAAGAVLAPLAAAALAVGAAHEAVESASRSAAGEQLGAATGGHTSHAGGSSMPAPSRSGAGRTSGSAGSASSSSSSGSSWPSSSSSSGSSWPISDGGGLDDGGSTPTSSWASAGGGGIGDAAAAAPAASFGVAPDAPTAPGGFDMPAPDFSGDAPPPGDPGPSDGGDSFFAAPVTGADGAQEPARPDFLPPPGPDPLSVFGPAPLRRQERDTSAPMVAPDGTVVGALPQRESLFTPPTPSGRRDTGTPLAPPTPSPMTVPVQPPARRWAAPRWPFGRRSR